jgi:hypothetical protein
LGQEFANVRFPPRLALRVRPKCGIRATAVDLTKLRVRGHEFDAVALTNLRNPF